jgi:cell division protein FtsL
MREAGNLALEPVLTQGLEGLDWSKPSPTLARRVLLDESSTARMLPIEEKARQVRRNLAIRRVRSLVSLIVVVLAVTGIFGLIVYRQARILELNFANLKLERTIDKTMQSTGQLGEQLARRTNLEQIRQQAIDRLGLQVPARQQIYVVDIPDSDRVVYASASTLDNRDEAVLADVFVNIEGFFKTLKIPGQTS